MSEHGTRTRYLSLFAGVGGFDLGADAAGWECVGQVEWDQHCQKVLRRHWPHVPKWGDVRDARVGVRLSEQSLGDGLGHGTLPGDEGLASDSNRPLPVADVIVGGFPCQDVSVAGKRAGLGEGTRSGLYGEIIRIVKEMRNATANQFPRWVILENVKGLLSIDKGDGFRTVLEDLADCGAHLIEWAVLDSQFFGVPQRRQRVFIAACFDPATADSCPDPLFPVAARVPRHLAKGAAKGTPAPADPATGAGTGSGLTSTHTHTPSRRSPAPESEPAAQTTTKTKQDISFPVATLNSGGNRGGFRTEPGEHLVTVAIPIQDGRDIEKAQNGLGIGEAGDPMYTLDATGAQAVVVNDPTVSTIGPLTASGMTRARGTESVESNHVLAVVNDAVQVDGSDTAATLRGFGHGWQGQHNSTNAVVQNVPTDDTVGCLTTQRPVYTRLLVPVRRDRECRDQ